MSPATIAALREALGAPGHDGVLDSRLRPAARMVCDDARASGLPVEQLLTALTTEWAEVLTGRCIEDVSERSDLTSRFITLCVFEFYADAPARRAGRPLTDGTSHTSASRS